MNPNFSFGGVDAAGSARKACTEEVILKYYIYHHPNVCRVSSWDSLIDIIENGIFR